jgi:hypothetical protein
LDESAPSITARLHLETNRARPRMPPPTHRHVAGEPPTPLLACAVPHLPSAGQPALAPPVRPANPCRLPSKKPQVSTNLKVVEIAPDKKLAFGAVPFQDQTGALPILGFARL